MDASSYDAAVVGAGMIGLAIGWRAARLGLKVVVIDGDAPPSGASHVAAGMLAPVTEATFGEEKLLALNIESARRWPQFAAELEEASGVALFHDSPATLHAAAGRDQTEALRRLYDYQLSLGLEVDWLSAAQLRKAEPALAPAVRSAVSAPGDRSVDPREALRALEIALEKEGGELRYGTPVACIDGTAVELAGGELISAAHVVVAAGCRSGMLPGVPQGLKEVLRPVKGQILRLRIRPSTPQLGHTVRTEEVYLVPRPTGEVVVGATVEEMGFDTTPTAGAVLELLRAADEVVPGIREMELAEISAGLRPATPDNAPLIGATSIPGVLLATGHFRNGILLAPVTAAAIVQMLAGEEAPPEVSGFAPGRFGL